MDIRHHSNPSSGEMKDVQQHDSHPYPPAWSRLAWGPHDPQMLSNCLCVPLDTWLCKNYTQLRSLWKGIHIVCPHLALLLCHLDPPLQAHLLSNNPTLEQLVWLPQWKGGWSESFSYDSEADITQGTLHGLLPTVQSSSWNSLTSETDWLTSRSLAPKIGLQPIFASAHRKKSYQTPENVSNVTGAVWRSVSSLKQVS